MTVLGFPAEVLWQALQSLPWHFVLLCVGLTLLTAATLGVYCDCGISYKSVPRQISTIRRWLTELAQNQRRSPTAGALFVIAFNFHFVPSFSRCIVRLKFYAANTTFAEVVLDKIERQNHASGIVRTWMYGWAIGTIAVLLLVCCVRPSAGTTLFCMQAAICMFFVCNIPLVLIYFGFNKEDCIRVYELINGFLIPLSGMFATRYLSAISSELKYYEVFVTVLVIGINGGEFAGSALGCFLSWNTCMVLVGVLSASTLILSFGTVPHMHRLYREKSAQPGSVCLPRVRELSSLATLIVLHALRKILFDGCGFLLHFARPGRFESLHEVLLSVQVFLCIGVGYRLYYNKRELGYKRRSHMTSAVITAAVLLKVFCALSPTLAGWQMKAVDTISAACLYCLLLFIYNFLLIQRTLDMGTSVFACAVDTSLRFGAGLVFVMLSDDSICAELTWSWITPDVLNTLRPFFSMVAVGLFMPPKRDEIDDTDWSDRPADNHHNDFLSGIEDFPFAVLGQFRHFVEVIGEELSRLVLECRGGTIVIVNRSRPGSDTHLARLGKTAQILYGAVAIAAGCLWEIFDTTREGHDGAVIVHLCDPRDGRFAPVIFSKRNMFPMPAGRVPPRIAQKGSRHRSAYGICERSDAHVFTVSEERGTLTYMHKGRVISIESAVELCNVLAELCRQTQQNSSWKHYVQEFLGADYDPAKFGFLAGLFG